MIYNRIFKEQDAKEVSEMVRRTLRETNSKDYSEEYIENDVAKINENFFIERSRWTNCERLESDEYFLRAKRIEIPASITALSFYQKLGYDFKNGVDQVEEEGLYRLEKFI